MSNQESPVNQVTRQYREAGQMAVDRVRDALDTSAEWVDGGKQPIKVLTEKTLKLNRITHNSAARLVRIQSEFVEGSVGGAAQRLQALASARDIRHMVDGQVQLMPATRERVVADARKTLDVIGDTRDDLTALIRETLAELRGSDPISEAADGIAEGAEKVAKKARKTARKSPARKSPAKKTSRKKTSKKTTRRKKTS
ncbi:MAG: phasin family protein [Gammaproteobacteria bacterium]|nr:phasin family protein [Gammaproteobacteria bacterium]NND60299.1 phasin family protein [Gammaproteobacteria bacterium]